MLNPPNQTMPRLKHSPKVPSTQWTQHKARATEKSMSYRLRTLALHLGHPHASLDPQGKRPRSRARFSPDRRARASEPLSAFRPKRARDAHRINYPEIIIGINFPARPARSWIKFLGRIICIGATARELGRVLRAMRKHDMPAGSFFLSFLFYPFACRWYYWWMGYCGLGYFISIGWMIVWS